MKIYKNKLMRVINFIKNEGKFENGDHIDFKASELEKIQPEDLVRYKKLNIEY